MFPIQQIQESNPIREYIVAMVLVVFIGILWVIFNELIMGVGNVAIGMVDGTALELVNFLILIYRITPIFMIIAVWTWAFFRAFAREPFEQFG